MQINPALRKYRIRSLTPAILKTIVNDLYRKDYSKSSLDIFVCVVNNALHPWGYLKENPMQYIIMPKYVVRKTTEKDLKILPMESLRVISEYCVEGHPLSTPFFIGLHAGLRVSEVCGLQWEHVDLERGTLRIEQAMINKEGVWVLDSTKTASSERDIHIGQTLVNI